MLDFILDKVHHLMNKSNIVMPNDFFSNFLYMVTQATNAGYNNFPLKSGNLSSSLCNNIQRTCLNMGA